jgi:drug/metabolite transporter (DMT)-like permease
MTLKSALALLWLGPLGTTAAYLFWIYVLARASVSSMTLTLFVQPVMGAFFGYLFLKEQLTALQLSGGALILAAAFGQAALSQKNAVRQPKP